MAIKSKYTVNVTITQCPYCGLVIKESEYLEHVKDCDSKKRPD
jgi:uncharacterized C2H2 Zn-finger protein